MTYSMLQILEIARWFNIGHHSVIEIVQAIVCRQKQEKNVIVELTEDHNPQKYEERERIEKAGGVVKYVEDSY